MISKAETQAELDGEGLARGESPESPKNSLRLGLNSMISSREPFKDSVKQEKGEAPLFCVQI